MVKLEKQTSNDAFTFCSPNDIFDDEIEIKQWAQMMEGFGQEIESPKLWKNKRHVFGYANYPSSQAQEEIAGYRKQMLDMIKDVPEPAYELTLRDIAELPKAARRNQEPAKKKKGGKNSSDISTGAFILKMLVPPSPRRSFAKSYGSSKVSPKPQTNHDRKIEATSRSSSSSSSTSTCTERSMDVSIEDSTSSTKKKKQGCFPPFDRKPSRHHKYLT